MKTVRWSAGALMLPAVIAVYLSKPALVPMAFAAIMGGHFLPYWWLQRTKAYLFGALASALGPWVLTMFVGVENSFHFTGFFVGGCLAVLGLKAKSDAQRGVFS